MRHQLLNDDHGQRMFAVVLETGDETMACLQDFVRVNQIPSAQLTGVGASADVTLGYSDRDKRDYVRYPVHERVEVASMTGDVALPPSGEPTLHIHVVLGTRDGMVLAGDLQEAHVQPTPEVILHEASHAASEVQRSLGSGAGAPRCRPRVDYRIDSADRRSACRTRLRKSEYRAALHSSVCRITYVEKS